MLIHAAAGGTGQLAVQMAKNQGFKVIGTCSSGKMDIVKQCGADYVVDYNHEDVVERVMDITNGVGVRGGKYVALPTLYIFLKIFYLTQNYFCFVFCRHIVF